MKSFLAIGECMVELAPIGDGAMRMGFAGDTFNTAWYARRLLPDDWSVAYGTCVGTDQVSDDMLAFMAAERIDTSAIRRLPDRTVGLYMISLRDGERSFSYWRGQSAARRLADDPDALDRMLAGRSAVHVSGITLAILPQPDREALCAALARARAKGSHIAFDTNLRPRLWESPEAMKAGLTLGASVADTVLPSFDEETQLFGDATPAETAHRYAALGAREIAVKNGAQDLHVMAENHIHVFTPPRVRQVDSTAAGDSFGAAWLSARLTGADIDTAAQRAMGLASRVVQERGALVRSIFAA
ncbi:sugar kinase [Seohaeicola zhoushanensis]|uniref:2-dehydro-3-deoxygluconokinase n=1 Tax=Seohaeicola zhoushanensis TaxID=1569283 RepID=A0A8J3M680_9RHOB|nr:sugar kinase [Seohaeicola zhoushanensis]GHF45960.1 2-dehydro-3-deoxygluconokinase [Seohaeicola zhoushanensis]